MNIPLGILAIVLTLTLLRRLPRHDRPHKLDFLGAALIMTASSSFMLALSMGGVSYPWASTPIVALLAAAVLLGAAFIVRLRTAPEPLIPLAILGDRQVRLRHRRQRVRVGTDRRSQHLPADLSAEHRRPGARAGRLERARCSR